MTTADASDVSEPIPRRREFGTFVFAVVLGSIFTNVGLGLAGNALNGLLFLDTIGTAIAAVSLGPWWGALVGAVTNLIIAEIPCRQQYFNYLVVNVFCGLAWGYLARGWPKLFVANGRYARLFIVLLSFGAAVGLVSSVLSLFTTFNFVWRLSDVDPDAFRKWHLTDEYYRWLLKSKNIDLQHGTLLEVVYRDIIAILPDKIVAICIATLIIYYTIPKRFLIVRGKDLNDDLFFSRVGLTLFIITFALCFVLILARGNVSIDPSTCLVNGYKVIIPQILIWLTPLLAASWLLWLSFQAGGTRYITGNPVIEAESFELKPKKYVQAVYKDLLTILTAVFAVLLALKQRLDPNSSVQLIADLLSDGFGIAAFFAVVLFVPGFLFRLFSIGPDVHEAD